MLQTLREKTSGWIAGLVLGLLSIPFLFFGVNNYFSPQVNSWVAKVGEVEISQQDFRSRYEQFRARMRDAQGESFDAAQFDSLETKQQLLDRLIDEEVLRQTASRLGMLVGPAQLQKEIAGMEVFHTDGRFDPHQYRLLLATQNMSPRAFEASVRADLETRALSTAVAGSAPVATAEVENFLRLRDQTRELRYFELPALAADAVAEPSEQQLADYFAAQAARYVSEEKVLIEYVELAAADLEVPAAADDETLQQRYDEQKARFTETAQRLASHILIKVAANADAGAQQEAQSRAQELVAKARAEAADFAALAREHSEDPGSKAAGGDLGWIETGFTDPAFESALFALQAGEISEPVKSSEGWHVIWLREVREGKVKPFADVREQLQREFEETERERRFNELAGRLVDLVYQDPTTLAAASKELDLSIQQAGPFGRSGGMEPVSQHADVLKFVFSPKALAEQQASDPIEIADGRTVLVRVIEHQPSKALALTEISDQVRSDYLRERRQALAKEQAEAALARLAAGEAIAEVAKQLGAELRQHTASSRFDFSVEPPVVSRAYSLAPPASAATPARAVVEMPADRFAVLELLAVTDGDPAKTEAAGRSALRDQLAEAVGAAETQALIGLLRAGMTVQTAPERL